MGTNKTTNWRNISLIGGAVLVVAVLSYYSFVYPWPNEAELAGTIGGVEKADKYRSEQITDQDVQLSDDELQALLQSDKG